jgi:ABC-type uncharacterized transport system ATPase subunit
MTDQRGGPLTGRPKSSIHHATSANQANNQAASVVYLKGVTKRFGQVSALTNVNLIVAQGEIHGLLGENGAGKSSLMKILYGLYTPDEGELYIEGRACRFRSPSDSIVHGIGMVHQVSTLVPEFTAVENIILGAPGHPFTLPLNEARERVKELSSSFGLSFPLDVRVGTLSAGIKQKIEIVRALYRGARILILDEPTTSLVESEFRSLLKSLRKFVADGLTVILITHKIREVLEACDAVTVLRRGEVQGRIVGKDMEKNALVQLMFAERAIEVTDSALPNVSRGEVKRSPKPTLSFVGASVSATNSNLGLSDITLDVHAGEIVGVAAVSGNGESDLAELAINPQRLSSGDIRLAGESVRGSSTLDVFDQGVSYTPEDRIREGILNDGSIAFNMLLGHQRDERYVRSGMIDWPAVRAAAERQVSVFNVSTPSIDIAIRRLSGGNIQKTILARAFLNEVQLLITHNPTSGLDIATVEAIFKQLEERRQAGTAILWINEDLDELMIMSDRIAVLHNGRINGVFERDSFDKHAIGLAMLGGNERESEQ